MKFGLELEHPAPVLSVSTINGATLDQAGAITPGSKILVGVRCALTHLTHPDTVSIPTQRIPGGLLDDFYIEESGFDSGEMPLPALTSEIQKIQPGKKHMVTDGTGSHDPVKYAVESILSKKLLLEKALEEKKVNYIAEPGVAINGFVLYEKISDVLPGTEIELQGRK